SAPQDSELGQPPGNGHGLERNPQESSLERPGGRDISDLPAAVQLAESVSPSIPRPASISNEGICSYSAEDVSKPNPSMVSSEVTGQNTILQEEGGQTESHFLKQAAGAREGSLSVSVPFAECAKESVTGHPTSGNDKSPASTCNEAVPSPAPVNDKEGTAQARSMDRGPKCDNIAVTCVENNENDPSKPSLESSPPAAITATRGVSQMSVSELGGLWQGEQLGGRRDPHVSTCPQGTEAGDYIPAQEAKQEQGGLEAGQPQAVMQQGRQNPDGGEGLLMKEETLILNYPATGGSDSEKCGAIVNAQGFTGISEVCNLQLGDVTTAKGNEANPALSASKEEQSEACTSMSELPSNPLLLVPKPEEPSREYVPGNYSQDAVRNEVVKTAADKNKPSFQRELQKEDELVSAEHSSVPLSLQREGEQNSAVTTESPKDEASSNGIIKAEAVSRESTTLSETERVINPTTENTLVDKSLLLEEYALSTSLSRSTELNQKETKASVTGDKKEIRAEVTESSELTEGLSGAQRQLLNPVSSHHQDVENTLLGHNPQVLGLCEKTSTGDPGEEAGAKPLNLDFKSPNDNSQPLDCKPEQQTRKEKTDATNNLENKPVASPQFPRQEFPLGLDCFNTEAEDKPLGQLGCNRTDKVCLAHAHSSLPLHSENNHVKQSKQDEPWEKALARETVLESDSKSKPELQGLSELARPEDRMALQDEKGSWVSDTEEHNSHIMAVPCSDSEQGPAAAQRSGVGGKENEGIQQEKHQAVVESFVEDKDLALKGECKSDVLMPAQLEQVACSETTQADVGTSGLTPRVEEGGDSHGNDNHCPSEHGTCSSLETLDCSVRELQENADVPRALPQAEQMERSVCAAGDSSWVSNTGLKQQQHQSSLTTVTRADDQEHKERAVKPERLLDLNNDSSIPEIPLDIPNNLNKESSVLDPVTQDTTIEKDKDKSSAVVSETREHGQNTPGVTMFNLQDRNEQNKTDLKAEENCCSKHNPDETEQGNNSLISASQHEAACQNHTFAKGSDKIELPGRIEDNSGESQAAAAIKALPRTQNSASATNTSQALPSDMEPAHTSDKPGKNDPQISHPEMQGKRPLMAKNSEKTLTADGGVIQSNGNMEESAAVTETSNVKSAKSPGAQGCPSASQAHGEVTPTNKLYEPSCLQKTAEEPRSCQADFTALSTHTSALGHPGQQPGNHTASGTGGETLSDEREVVAHQNALEGNSDLEIDAGSQVHLGPSPSVSTSKPANPDNSSGGEVHVNGIDVPHQSFQGDGDRSSALPETVNVGQSTVNVGQSTANLSQFSSEKLKKEISAIKSPKTKSEVNFKAQQNDSSAESLLTLPALEGKLLSLSSSQESCNEEIASSVCVDDKHGKILEKPGNSEEMEELSKENNNVTGTELSTSEQTAGSSGREHEALTCSSLDIGSSFPDFREHISQIFKSTVQSTLSAELPQRLPENHAGFKQRPVAMDTAGACGAENSSGSNKVGKGAPEGTSEAEEQELPLAPEASCRGAKGKSLQQGNTAAELPPASLQDAEENKQPSRCLEVVPALDGTTPAARPLEHLQKPEQTTEHPRCGEMEGEEGVCVSGVDPESLISLGIKKQGPASFGEAAAENFPACSDSKQQPAGAVTSIGDAQKRDLEDAATAEGNNLITECSTELVSSEEDVNLPTEQRQDPKANEQEKSEYSDADIAKSISDMAASTLVPGGSYNHEKLPGNFNASPGGNQETHVHSSFMHDSKSQSDVQVIQDDPVDRKCLETLENQQDAQQEEKGTVHGLIDYLKTEVSQDDCLQTDSTVESSNMTEGDIKENSDMVLSTTKSGNIKTEDTPETGTARMLVTGEGDLAINTSTEEQDTELYKNHSPATPVMEQGERSARTDLTDAENQPSKMNPEDESLLQDATGKLSLLALAEPKNLDLAEVQDMAVAGLPTE
ncbi:PREDICTED: uncharacterized protein LOC104411451, partial [Nestor notabilis]|uniref:uncharacterized protein LOC104411451 n=1 Tax=Nestor notabilis TaxID=176057 RepID=UPI0005232AA8